MALNKLLFAVFLLLQSLGYGQKSVNEKIDSLIQTSNRLRYTSPEESLEIISKAYEYSLRLNDTSLILKSGIVLAKTLNENGLYQNSLKTAIKIKGYCNHQTDSINQIAEIYYTKGYCYLEMEQFNKAQIEFDNALESFKLLNDSSGLSSTYISLGNIESHRKHLNKAINLYQKSLKFTPSDDQISKAYISTNMGIIYAENHQYEKAKLNFEQTNTIYKELNLLNELSISYYDLGYLEYTFKNYSKAIKNYQRSLNIAKDNNNATDIMWAYEGLYQVYKDQNQHKNALFYFEKYSEIKDSLNEIQKSNEIKDVEKLLEKENQELLINNQLKEIEEARIKEELYKERITKSALKARILGAGFILICILAGIGFFIHQKVKKKNILLTNQKEIINKSLQEKEILLKEIHHRVKNNLQIISSLLNLQSSRIDNDKITVLLNESKNRIQAIALVHDKLYRSNDFTSINFKEYLLEILEQQKHIYLNPNQELQIQSDCEDVFVKLDLAVPLGLIASELITNAFKHGFNNNTQPTITVHLNQTNTNEMSLLVGDNGIGLPSDFNIDNSNTLGMELITALTEQINGKITFKNNNGTQFTVVFNV